MRISLLFFLLSLILNGTSQTIEWANEVKEYSSQRGVKQYSAEQVLGKPNVLPQGGASPCAWEPLKEKNKKGEILYVRFKNPLFTKQIIICESLNPGAISKIELINTSGYPLTVYENEKPQAAGTKTRVFGHVLEEPTKHKVKGVKVYLQTNAVDGYNAIDAIGISESDEPFVPRINLITGAGNYGKPENLSAEVNSVAHEFLPQISPDGKKLYFSRRFHPENHAYKSLNEEQGVADDDIWLSEFNGGKWTDAVRLPEPLNNDFPNAAYTITPDGNSLLLSGAYSQSGAPGQGVSYSYKQLDGWSFPKALSINDFYNSGPYSEFFLSTNKKILLMTIVRNEGYGDNDIYVSFIQNDKTWSVPKNIGPIINTAGVESSPFLAADGRTLYFSSDGFSGFGKRDLFMTKRLGYGWDDWSEPVNLGSVINSEENESYYSIPASGEYAYFVSSKKSLGRSDIFRIKLPNEIKPAPVSLISGKVYDKSTGQLIKDAIEIDYEILPEGIDDGAAQSDPQTSEFSIVLPHDLVYAFRPVKEGYFGEAERLDLTVEEHKNYEEISIDLKLVPIEVGQHILLHNVSFVQGKSDLEDLSYPELNRVVKLLKSNPTMKIRLEGHTEAKGYQDWNKKLSEERVIKVRDYMVANGVKATQLETIGYGGSKPAYGNDQSEFNRRIEFEVLEK